MNNRIYWSLLLLISFLFSCEMKKDLFGEKEGQTGDGMSIENVGLLDLEVNAEKETPVPGTKGDSDIDETLNSDDFAVSILDSLGQLVKSYESFAAIKEEGELLLPPGLYQVSASLGDNVNAGFDQPYYAGDTTCIISAKEVAKVVAKCRLQNKKLQFGFSDKFLQQFKGDYTIVADNGVGVLTIPANEERVAYLKNSGTLRFTVYATTKDEKACTYSVDLSKEDTILEHNNVYIELDTESINPIPPDTPDGGDEGEEPEEPVDPDEPEVPGEPGDSEQTVARPLLKVDISLVEKDYVIEIPSVFEESEKPDTPGGDPDTPGGGDEPGGDTQQKIGITGTIDGRSFDVNQVQTITSTTKSVVINLYLPTGLSQLDVDVSIGADIKLSLDLLNKSSVDEVNGILANLGKKLVVPSKGDKGNLKFDISGFLGLMDTSNSFKISLGDKNGEKTNATIKLNKK
ncbi:DUF4493 domain-containing protein [uncultured Parabacteroides sp.]|uniref:DUF4493 domain-containing protein n=1 Tax=uncultured Parabacteroides sp. TaxID=512312 RepID=UPI00258630EF|nr:DUF4493 domain-containing protein [uncultured Parabacteroides sp.]